MSEVSETASLLSHTGWIQALARKLASDPDLADDAVQDTWLAALERRPATGRPVRGWLATVLRHRVKKLARHESNRRSRERVASRDEATPSTHDLVAKASSHRDLVELVLALEEPYRGTVLLRFFEGLSYGQIASRTGVTPATVNSRVTRALARLRQRLDQEHGGRQTWLSLLAPLWNHSGSGEALGTHGGGVALGTKGSTMMTLTHASLLLVATSTVGALGWQALAGPTGPPAVDALNTDPQAPLVSLAGTQAIPEGIELRAPASALSPGPARELATLADANAAQPDAIPQDRRWHVALHEEIPLWSEDLALAIDSRAGDVTVLPGEGANLVVDVEVYADVEVVPSSELTPHFADHVSVERDGQKLAIEGTHRDEGWVLSFTVSVPRRLSLAANAGAGNVESRYATHEQSLNAGAGNVIVNTPRAQLGVVRANAGAGNVEVEVGGIESLTANVGAGNITAAVGAASAEQVQLSAGAGNVSLTLPQNVAGRFDLDAAFGTIEVAPELSLEVLAKGTAGAEARGIVGAGNARFEISTGSGNIAVELAH